MLLFQQDVHETAKLWLTGVDVAAKTLIAVVGGGWTLMYYLRGRIHKHKPLPEATVKYIRLNGEPHLSVMCRIKNIGLTKYQMEQKGTAWSVWALTESAPGTPAPEHLIWVGSIFQGLGWLEPGGQFDNPQLLSVPLDLNNEKVIAFRVALRAISRGVETSTSCIVEIMDNEPSGIERTPGRQFSIKEV